MMCENQTTVQGLLRHILGTVIGFSSSYLATLWVPPAEADPHGVRGGREGDEDGHDGDGQGGEAVGVHGEGGVDGADYDSATDKFGKTFGTECSKIVIMSHNLRDLY